MRIKRAVQKIESLLLLNIRAERFEVGVDEPIYLAAKLDIDRDPASLDRGRRSGHRQLKAGGKVTGLDTLDLKLGDRKVSPRQNDVVIDDTHVDQAERRV